jgi:hypothetical protein
MPECVIIGLPGAGTTTFYRRYFAATHRHVSKDLWPYARRREARQQQVLQDALASGESVVVDNTNPTRLERARATEEFREVVEFLQKYTNLGGRIPKGVLLLGHLRMTDQIGESSAPCRSFA